MGGVALALCKILPAALPLPLLSEQQLLALITAACQFSIQISSLSGECRGPFHQPGEGLRHTLH